MTIAHVETIWVDVTARGGWLFVRLHTDDGLTGVGEASHGGDDARVGAIVRDVLFPRLAGRHLDEIDRIWPGLLRQREQGRPDLATATALSGLEQALWDLKARRLGVPLVELLGGRRRDAVRVYANINRAIWDRSPEGFAAVAREAVAAGFHAVKCAPFDEVTPASLAAGDWQQVVAPGLARVEAVRAAIGPDIELMVDCHGRLTVPVAIALGRALEALGVGWLEEPVWWHEDRDGLRAITAELAMPVAAAETAYGAATFLDLCTARAADILMPDVKHCGGVWEARMIGAVAEAAGVAVSPHNPSGPVSTLASLHVAAASPNVQMLEYPFGEVPWRATLAGGAERLVDGAIRVPDSPGIGIAPDFEALAARYDVRVSDMKGDAS